MNTFTIEDIQKIDPQNSLASTEKLIEQLKTAWEQANALPIPKFENINKVIFCGMGASIYGALVTRALLNREFIYPTEMVTDYHLPEWVDEQTLVVLTSYSGTTEEVLSCAEEALAEKAKMLVLTKGGPLADWARKNSIPAYIFDGVLNPAGTPRLGLGYTIFGLMGLLNKSGIIDIEEHELTFSLERFAEKYEDMKNQAMQDSEMYVGKIPVIIAAEHLAGNAQIMRNQFNETSKTFSTLYLVPDLNHHLMEGLQFPKFGAVIPTSSVIPADAGIQKVQNNSEASMPSTTSPLVFFVMGTKNYSEKIQKRMTLTIDVLRKNNHFVHEFMTDGQSMYDDFLELLVYSSFLTLYLAYRYDQNPATNPWVDYFKDKLNK
jgi:glucose/mannose-6-phosphate isomerase